MRKSSPMLAMALAAGIAGMAGLADAGPSFRVDRDGDVYPYQRQRPERGARGFSATKRRARNKAAKASRRKNRK